MTFSRTAEAIFGKSKITLSSESKENVRLGPLNLRHTPVLNRQVRSVQVFDNTIIPAG